MSPRRSRVSLTPQDPTFSEQEDSFDASTDVKKHKIVRRHGACRPCRAAKAKCDGQQPCGTCRNESKKKRTCEYSEHARRFADRNQKVETSASASSSCSSTERRDRTMSTRAKGSDPPPSQSEIDMHKVLLLRGVVDEFVNIGPPRGRPNQHIDHIQNLWSKFTENCMTDTSPLNICQTLSSENDDNSREPPTRAEQVIIQEKVAVWQAQLDTIEQLVSAGKLLQAWNSIAPTLREIESFDIEHEPVLRKYKATSERMTSICLKLIDLECALSFFVGGASHLTSWTQSRFLSSKINQQKADDHLFAVKTNLYSEIQAVVQTDVSHKEGLWKFLNIVYEMGPQSPATDLIKIALSTKEDDTAGMQELQLISHLCLVVLCCRTAVVSAHYSAKNLPRPRNGHSDIVDKLQLCSPKKKSHHCQKAIMHARAVLQIFENLCKIDAEETAHNWLRVYGALIAIIVIAIAELRGQEGDDETDRNQLSRIEACFKALRTRNRSSIIVEKALEIFQQLEADSDSQDEVVMVNSKKNLLSRKNGSDSTHDKGSVDLQILSPMNMGSMTLPTGPSVADDMANKSIPLSKGKRKRTAQENTIHFDVIVPPSPEREMRTHVNQRTGTTQSPVISHPFRTPELDTTSSFGSTHGALTGHPYFNYPIARYHHHDEISHPPRDIWGNIPSIPHGQKWDWCGPDCECLSFQQNSGSMVPLIEPSYLDSQAERTYQPNVTIQPTTSFSSYTSMMVQTPIPTQDAMPHAMGGSAVFAAGLEDGESAHAIASHSDQMRLQSAEEHDMVDMENSTLDGYSISRNNCDSTIGMHQDLLQSSRLVPLYDNGPELFSPSYTFEPQYGHAGGDDMRDHYFPMGWGVGP